MEKKQSLIMTIGAVVLIVIVVMGALFIDRNEDTIEKSATKNTESALDTAQTVASALYEGGKDKLFKSEAGVVEESTGPVHYPDVKYDYSFMEQTAEDIYEELYTNTEEKTDYIHFYIEDGTLYLDEYVETGEYDEEGIF